MKKIIYLLTIVVSMSIFANLFVDKNKKDLLNLSNLVSLYLGDITNKESRIIEISIDNKKNVQDYLNKLLQLAENNDYIVTSTYNSDLDDTSVLHTYYTYDKNNIIQDYLIKYYVDDINDCKDGDIFSTTSNLKLINNFFLVFNDVYEFKSYDTFVEDVNPVNNDIVFLYVWSNDNNLVDQQVHEIADGIIEIETIDGWESEEYVGNIILTIFMILSIICLIVSIIQLFLNNKKEIGIAKLLGYNHYDILKKYLLDLLVKIFILFISCHCLLSFIFVENLTENAIIFLKDLIIKDIIFILFLSILSIIVFFAIIKKINLKKSVNYQPLMDFIYILKIGCIFLFGFIFVSNFYSNEQIIKETWGMLKTYDFCEDYYRIYSIVDSGNGNKAQNLLVQDKKAITCFQYSEENDEIPFLIVNENYIHLFNDDQTIKNNMLVVPSKYQGMPISKYMISEDIKLKYVDYSCVYEGLAVYPEKTYYDPIIFVTNEDYYSPRHILLSKDKTIDEYKHLVSKYIDTDELSLKDANRELMLEFILYTLPILIEMIFYASLFIFSFIMIIYIFMKIYFEQYNKEIAVKNTLGYRFMEIYYPIYAMHIMAYILPMILVGFMLKDIQVLLIFFVMTFSFDFIVQTILLKMNHRKSKLMLLKDGE